MKLNWGTSIVIAFALFMAFILYFVVKVQSNAKYNNELVVEDYYKHDATFGKELEKIQSATDLEKNVAIVLQKNNLSITFPEGFDYTKISGKVSFYRPSNMKLDFEIPISLTGSNLLFAKSKLLGGVWNITVNWSYDNKDYISKQSIYIE